VHSPASSELQYPIQRSIFRGKKAAYFQILMRNSFGNFGKQVNSTSGAGNPFSIAVLAPCLEVPFSEIVSNATLSGATLLDDIVRGQTSMQRK
jgi:hypothetical protein